MLKNHLFAILTTLGCLISFAQQTPSNIHYTVSMKNPENQRFQIQMDLIGFQEDTLELKLPNWSPGYYQIMNYFENIEDIKATHRNGTSIPIIKLKDNTWQMIKKSSEDVRINYKVHASKRFVANSFLDTTRAYIVPPNNFLYPNGYLNSPSVITIDTEDNSRWNKIATGLMPLNDSSNSFVSKNYDILYDSPLLIGNLETLTPFQVREKQHRFIGYKLGEFDSQGLMKSLQKIIETTVEFFDDIPYDHYTFIGIGPGRGGIEHLNSTTVSFDGNNLKTQQDVNRMLNFLTHEYFHHYNTKRIRPFELGPFDYDQGSRTNQLWIAEGLTVYYEYIISKKAGIKDTRTFFSDLEHHINAVENNPGRLHQSLSQSSYNTWSDGPFGNMGEEKGRTISYYDKGPLVGLILDLEIRKLSSNTASLNDVMYILYHKYYKELNRGFTEAEFQGVCEQVAQASLKEVFEYVYTTKELNYKKYLGYAGLTLDTLPDNTTKSDVKSLQIKMLPTPNSKQLALRNAWLNQKN